MVFDTPRVNEGPEWKPIPPRNRFCSLRCAWAAATSDEHCPTPADHVLDIIQSCDPGPERYASNLVAGCLHPDKARISRPMNFDIKRQWRIFNAPLSLPALIFFSGKGVRIFTLCHI